MQAAEKDNALLTESDAERSAPSQGPYALPLISVIVPIYNVEVYLDRCIESICGQTYQNLEIILVDDGSPDNCPAICDAWAERDSRITVIRQENKGVSAARNAGLCAMKGEYFGFIDSDDYILPRYFEHLYGLVVDYNADMALSKFLMIDENGAAVPSELLRTRINAGIYRGKDILEEIFLIYVWGKLYRSEVCQNTGFLRTALSRRMWRGSARYCLIAALWLYRAKSCIDIRDARTALLTRCSMSCKKTNWLTWPRSPWNSTVN
ncbi:MAG: glycosyltransferase family 2 protein [Coriobacteriales bacterium]|nr:glycosyltransferase family 2 protein [Coriobacteriales bacterium]